MTPTDSLPTAPDVRRDAGFTLPEVLVALALMGTVIAAIVGGLLVVTKATATSDEQAKVEAVLIGAADRLAAVPWNACPSGVSYLSAVKGAAANVDWDGSRVQIIDTKMWSRPATNPERLFDGNWVDVSGGAAGCQQEDAKNSPSTTVQRVTIQVTSPSGTIQRELRVVKSLVTDPSGLSTGP